MNKKVAVFNDISGFGRCSLTAAIPVLSVLGVQCNPIPTVVLTGQGGYTVKFRQPMTDMLPNFAKAWKANEASFDGIYTGYMAEPKQIQYVLQFLGEFRCENTFLLVDPVMGDNGRTYCSYSEELLVEMKKLVTHANLITPNLTEACLLTGEDFVKISSTSSKDELLEKVAAIASRLHQSAIVPQDVVITGVKVYEQKQCFVYNVAVTDNGVSTYSSVWLDKSYSGTGDLFSSCLCGLHMNGYSTEESIPPTSEFLYRGIADTMKQESDSNDGIEFERHLKYLAELVRN